MYISTNWLKNIISLKNISTYKNVNKKNLLLPYSEFQINKLTLSGFEIEKLNIEKNENILFEIDTTPNRNDTTNIVGFSKEIQKIMNYSLLKNNGYKNINKIPEFLTYSNSTKEIQHIVKDDAYINSFYQISNIKIEQSPLWLKKRLQNEKINPVNNLIDITNYIMIEWGQPLQVYDLDKIKKRLKLETNNLTLDLRYGKNNELVSFNNEEYVLKDNDIVLSANNETLSINSLLINQNFEIDETTTHIILECTNFNKKTIKSFIKRFGIKTQSSTLFDKEITIGTTNLAFQHTLKLLDILNPNKIKSKPILLTKPIQKDKKQLILKLSEIKSIIGKTKEKNYKNNSNLINIEIFSCLKKLNFTIIKITNNECLIEIPESRSLTIKTEQDIIEEIVRIYGFNNIQSILPTATKLGKITKEQKLINIGREKLINIGFNEIVSYSLNDRNPLKHVKLLNPLSNEYGSLRKSISSNLIETIIFNRNQRNDYFSFFEIGRIFDENTKSENNVISGIVGGEEYKTNWKNQPIPIDWYEAKGILNQLLKTLKIKEEWIQIKTNISLEYHPGRSALIFWKKDKIGTFSQIHPLYAKQKNLSTNLYFFELNLTRISQLKENNIIKYQTYSLYPKISKDISFEVPIRISCSEMTQIIKTIISKIDKKQINITIELFDNYQTQKTNKLRILGYRVNYQSINQTLIKTNIEAINEKLIEEIKKKL